MVRVVWTERLCHTRFFVVRPRSILGMGVSEGWGLDAVDEQSEAVLNMLSNLW